MPPSRTIGQHVLADLYGVAADRLRDESELVSLLQKALLCTGFHILSQSSFTFPGEHAGVTGVFLLGESHAAFHTYPEFEYMSLDIFSCGSADPGSVVRQVGAVLAAAYIDFSTHQRGGRDARSLGIASAPKESA